MRVLLLAIVAATVGCDAKDPRIPELEGRIARLESMPEKPSVVRTRFVSSPNNIYNHDLEDPPEWWCVLDPRGLDKTCHSMRLECRMSANVVGGICVLSDAPACYDVINGGTHVPFCFISVAECESNAKRVEAAIRTKCYRAETGAALEQARHDQSKEAPGK